MYLMTKLVKFKMVFAVALVMVCALALAPVALAETSSTGNDPDAFGLGGVGTNINLGSKDFDDTIAELINVALSLLGVVAVVIILIGGFKWMTAGGNDEKVTEARKWIFSGIIGLAIILSAWAITRFVFEKLSVATGAKDDFVY